MTNEEAAKMLTAKFKCMERENSGTDLDCDHRNCDECDLCYAHGTIGQQIEALKMAIKALKAQDVPDKKNELKPCPFCGGEAEMNVKHGSYGYTPDIYYVKCKRCGQKVEVVSERYKNLSDIAVGAWNRRA